MKKRTFEELQKEFDELDNAITGPDRYVLRGQKLLIESNAKVEEAIDNFSKSTEKTEKIMIVIAVVSALLALGQFITFFIKK